MEFHIPKHTGTYADALEAVGTADLLRELTGISACIEDKGPAFRVSSKNDALPEDWRPPTPGYPYIFLRKKEKTPPKGEVLDYEEEQGKFQGLRQFQAAKGKVRDQLEKVLRDQGFAAPPEPDREYRMASVLASMRMTWESDKKLFRWISEHPDETLEWVREYFEKGINMQPPVAVTTCQFFSPASGKGVHSTKTIAKSPGALNKSLIDPFREWMKYRGAFNAMMPYRAGKDFKIYVIEPADIEVSAIRDLRHTLLDLNLRGGIRLDIQASLRLAEILIMRSDVIGQGRIGLMGRRPNEVVKGLRQAFFKNLGTASAVMNDSFFPLPGWFVISDRSAADAFLGIIEEHIGEHRWSEGCLGALREDRSDDVPVLQQYREWLSTGELFDFLEFIARFAVHVFQKRANKEWVRELTIDNLSQLFLRGYPMKTEEIITNEGFVSIARAIRNSTIYAVGSGVSGREPKFGLAQNWKQKMKGGTGAFVPVLADFIQQYNWETAHKLEGKGHSIRESELSQVLGLIDLHGAELVGMLLLAFGYARKPKEIPQDED